MHYSNVFFSLLLTLTASPTYAVDLGPEKECIQVQCFPEDICADSYDDALYIACNALRDVYIASGEVFYKITTGGAYGYCSLFHDQSSQPTLFQDKTTARAFEHCGNIGTSGNGTTTGVVLDVTKGVVQDGDLYAWRAIIKSIVPASDIQAIQDWKAGIKLAGGGRIYGCFAKKWVRCHK